MRSTSCSNCSMSNLTFGIQKMNEMKFMQTKTSKTGRFSQSSKRKTSQTSQWRTSTRCENKLMCWNTSNKKAMRSRLP